MSDSHAGKIEQSQESKINSDFSHLVQETWKPQVMPKLDANPGLTMPAAFGHLEIVDKSKSSTSTTESGKSPIESGRSPTESAKSTADSGATRKPLEGGVREDAPIAPGQPGVSQEQRKPLEGTASTTQPAAPEVPGLKNGEFNPWEDITISAPQQATVRPDGGDNLQFQDGVSNQQNLTGNADIELSGTLSGEVTIPAFKTTSGLHASETVTAKFPARLYHEGEMLNGILNIPPVPGQHNFYNGLAGAHYENGELKGVPVQMVNGKMMSHSDREISIPLHLNPQ